MSFVIEKLEEMKQHPQYKQAFFLNKADFYTRLDKELKRCIEKNSDKRISFGTHNRIIYIGAVSPIPSLSDLEKEVLELGGDYVVSKSRKWFKIKRKRKILDKYLIGITNAFDKEITNIRYDVECLKDPMLAGFLDSILERIGIKTGPEALEGFSMDNVLNG
jgi:hypothetical protein